MHHIHTMDLKSTLNIVSVGGLQAPGVAFLCWCTCVCAGFRGEGQGRQSQSERSGRPPEDQRDQAARGPEQRGAPQPHQADPRLPYSCVASSLRLRLRLSASSCVGVGVELCVCVVLRMALC